MSERTFFSLRYALPGYTFILMFVLVAYSELEKILFPKEHVVMIAAFLTFLSLLGGSALGFLVAQVWYVVFNRFLRAGYGRFPDTIKDLTEEYGLIREKHHQIVFLDYVHRLSSEGIKTVTTRRYDLMHLCGSTLVSTLVGSIFAVSVRFYLSGADLDTILMASGFLCLAACGLLFGTPFPSTFRPEILLFFIPTILLFVLPEVTAHSRGAFLIVILLVFLLSIGLRHAKKEHAMATEVSVHEVVESGKFPVWKAKRVFPSHYFINESRNDET